MADDCREYVVCPRFFNTRIKKKKKSNYGFKLDTAQIASPQ